MSLVYDLSATPFFLRGSGYVEGTLFPWTMSDFSLMDAIECGIVKLPRVPVADNIPGGDTPKFRNLWDHIGKKMPKKGRGAGVQASRSAVPAGRTLDRAGGALRPLREDVRRSGRKPKSAFPRSSSSSATTPRLRNSSTNTSPASIARMTTDRRRSKTAGWRCFAISTSTATQSRGRTRS